MAITTWVLIVSFHCIDEQLLLSCVVNVMENSNMYGSIPQGIPQPAYHFQPCSKGYLSWQQLKIALFYLFYLEHRRSLVTIFRCAFRHFVGFYPPFLYLGDENDT